MSGFPVRIEGLAKRYRSGPEQLVAALDGVTLALEPGSVTGITGPSGSGKSTLLHLIGAMDDADQGTIRVADRDVTALSRSQQVAYRRTIGFVFQRFHLLPALTVLDNVAAPVLPRKQDFDVQERARELVAAVGLQGREHSLPSRLSGGQQQRVAIARALINKPGLLLADEPTGNLDSQTGTEIVELLLSLRDQTGMTIALATHDPVIASRCDTIIRLRDGQIVDHTSLEGATTPADALERLRRLDPH
jgi:putative ABC transport system ATP-binding protein